MEPPGASVTFASGRDIGSDADPPDLRLIHYNDVYHLDPSSAEPVGGVARFMTVCREYGDDARYRHRIDPVVLFSGDAFNPSLESTVTKGAHMVPVLNEIGTQCACVGNHDFDFGVGQFAVLTAKTKFPWLLANVLDPALGPDTPLANAAKTHMITTPNGIRIGLLGLGEREWLETINSLPPNLVYRSATETAKELVPELRRRGADVVICLSHQREPNDLKLARQTGGIIDIILGGHDHFYSHVVVEEGGTHVLRSGSDFKQLSYIEARRSGTKKGGWDFDIVRRDILSSIAPDRALEDLASSLTSKLQEKLAKPIGWTACPLDARFTAVRTRETNISNLVCDVMRSYHGADCALMAAGTVRGDQIYPPGAIRVRDITNCFPFEDPVVLLRARGADLWAALENGVSLHPALEGRFAQVSGMRYVFDPTRRPGQRVIAVEIGGRPLDREKLYTVATRGYMGRGKDGFDSLLVRSEGGHVEELVCEENGILISTMLRQYFLGLRTVKRWRQLSPCWRDVAVECNSRAAALGGLKRSPEDGGEEGSTSSSTRPGQDHPPRSWEEWLLRRKGLDVDPGCESDEDEDMVRTGTKTAKRGAARGGSGGGGGDGGDHMDWEVLLLRKFFGRWAEKAGVRREVCDSAEGEAASVDWTCVVAPVKEGRIIEVGGDGDGGGGARGDQWWRSPREGGG